MKIGLVGYQFSGKSTLFEWLTGVAHDPAQAHASQAAMAPAPDARVDQLVEIYKPKKISQASLEIVDTPGLSRGHEGSAQKLAAIREAGCLVVVLAAYGDADPAADLRNFEDDLLLADLAIVQGRVERLRESTKKPRPGRDQELAELEALEPILATLEAGDPLDREAMSEEQKRAIRSFQLFSEKRRLAIVNIDDDEENPDRFRDLGGENLRAIPVSLSLQVELGKMDDASRREFCEEMGVEVFDRDWLLREIMHASGQMLFFTAGEKEVRTWMIPQGATALEAADSIHSDLARGFIRAEVMQIDDLVRLGSEREVKAAGLMRQEHKDYVIQDGDILLIRHSG